MEKTNISKCKPPEVHFTIRTRVPYNKQLTNRARSSRTVEYWPSVVFVRTSLRSVRTASTSGQYSPVRPSRSVSKRLLLTVSSKSDRQEIRKNVDSLLSIELKLKPPVDINEALCNNREFTQTRRRRQRERHLKM